MSREIKFRMWWNNILQGFCELVPVKYSCICPAYDWNKYDQYTGLKDKNGKEIYEGDIVKFEYIGITIFSRVIFKEGSFCVVFENEENFPIYEYLHQELEVIGNIYENRELLEDLNENEHT